jgi:hypothetical protein
MYGGISISREDADARCKILILILIPIEDPHPTPHINISMLHNAQWSFAVSQLVACCLMFANCCL